MDSLLATYASSDSDDDEQHQNNSKQSSVIQSGSRPSLLSSLPLPKADSNPEKSTDSISSIFNTMQPPKSQSLSISLPPPKNKRKIVQFITPLSTAVFNDDEDDENSKKPAKKTSKKESSLLGGGLGSILPPPKNNRVLGSGSAPGSGRKNILETSEDPNPNPRVSETLVPNSNPNPNPNANPHYDASLPYDDNNVGYDDGVGNYDNNQVYGDRNSVAGNCDSNNGYGGGNYENYAGDGYTVDPSTAAQGGWLDTAQYDQQSGFSGQDYSAGNNYSVAQSKSVGLGFDRRKGKGAPVNVVEVKQAELIGNRPREDQSKLTGIAFGPAYKEVHTLKYLEKKLLTIMGVESLQSSSANKAKPNKLSKRKHQIGTLYYELKQKEMELQERRSKGQLTKAETQAKYGW